jgi:hypothetical protein
MRKADIDVAFYDAEGELAVRNLADPDFDVGEVREIEDVQHVDGKCPAKWKITFEELKHLLA